MFWLYRIFSLQGVSNLIRVIEIVGALLIALRPWSARLSFYRQHWCRHRVYVANGQFSSLDNRSLSVLTRISLVRQCWPILNQGSRPARCIDLDCRRSAQGKLVHSTASDSISTILKPLLDSRLSFNEPLTFVSADGTSKSRQGLTEYETPSAIICTKTNDHPDVMLENHATRALDDESGVPHSKSCFASCWLLNCPLNRFRPSHHGEIERMSGLGRKWLGHGKPTSSSSAKVLTCFRFVGPL